MADYGVNGQGGSLRDALNQLYPMLGLGEYNTMFPPALGSDQPSAPVPIPQPRPQQAPQLPPYAPLAGAALAGPAPALPGAVAGPPQLPAGLSIQGGIAGGSGQAMPDYSLLLRYARGF